MAREMSGAGLVLQMWSGSVVVLPRKELSDTSTVTRLRTAIRIRAALVGAQRRRPQPSLGGRAS